MTSLAVGFLSLLCGLSPRRHVRGRTLDLLTGARLGQQLRAQILALEPWMVCIPALPCEAEQVTYLVSLNFLSKWEQ